MSIKIPDALKSELPSNLWGKVLAATPVVMTVVATLLAGLSNGEMTRAQYARALAAQLQAKSGDQWGFFQAKRLRGAIQASTLDLLESTADRPVDAAALRDFAATLAEPAAAQKALDLLLAGRLPDSATPARLDPRIQVALDAIDGDLADAQVAEHVRAIPPEVLASALVAARQDARNFDRLLQPIVTHGDRVDDAIHAASRRDLAQAFARVRLRYASMRYDAEAALNRTIAVLVDLQVRQANLSAERHQRRSQRFFYGMLGAQAGVIIATFAMAARQRNLLWSLAAAAGLCAVSFAAYVFLFL